jgi:L-malate glycosyltransferase
MRILFANHTGTCSGAETAMIRLLASLRHDHEVAVACPPRGPLAESVEGAGIKLFSNPAIDMSLRLHPVWTLRGAGQLGAAGMALRSTANRWYADVVHANSLRAGLAGAAAARLGCPPVVVQSHEHLPLSRAGRAVRSAIAATASEVVAVTDRTARSFNQGLDRAMARRVYISIDHERFDPSRVSPAPVRKELGLSSESALLGQVAQITPWKGQDAAIRILADLRRRGTDAHLLIVGQIAFDGKAVRYDNHDYLWSLHQLVAELGVGHAVHFLGHRSDVPAILRALDLSLLPSRDEPFGTVVAESMAMGTPALVGADGGPSEYVIDGLSSRILPPGRHDLWAQAAEDLLLDRSALARMGSEARGTVARFNDETYGREMLEVYEHARWRRAWPDGVVERAASTRVAAVVGSLPTPADRVGEGLQRSPEQDDHVSEPGRLRRRITERSSRQRAGSGT